MTGCEFWDALRSLHEDEDVRFKRHLSSLAVLTSTLLMGIHTGTAPEPMALYNAWTGEGDDAVTTTQKDHLAGMREGWENVNTEATVDG